MLWPTPAEASFASDAQAVAAPYWKKRVAERDFCGRRRVAVVEDADILGWGVTVQDGCRIARRRGVKAEIHILPVARYLGFLWYCSIVIHEYGHLVGREHSPDPENVMHSPITERNLKRRACG